MPSTRPDNAPRPAPPKANARTIALFGGCDAPEGGDAFQFAYNLGRHLARSGFEVLNGGYGGTMHAASRGAREAGGVTIGVTCPGILRTGTGPLPPNPYLDEILPASDLLARIDTMMRLSGGYVVLDGGTGTLCELAVVWEHVSKGFLPPRPIVLAGRSWQPLLDRMKTHRPASHRPIHRAETPEAIAAVLTEHAVRGTRARFNRTRDQGPNDAATTVAQLIDIMQRFVDERDWQPFHDPKNLSASIAIEAAELMEHFQWLRTDQLGGVKNDPRKMNDVREELADILAYVLSFAATMDIDLSSALADKMKKNAIKYPADQYRGKFEAS